MPYQRERVFNLQQLLSIASTQFTRIIVRENIFDTISQPDDVEKYQLSAEQVSEFREKGSIWGVEVMSQAAVDRLRQGLSDIVNGRVDTSQAFFHGNFNPKEGAESELEFLYFQGAWLLDAAFHEIVYNPRITVPVAQLLGIKQVRLLHDQVFYKPAKHGSNCAWHQDYSYWTRTAPPKHMTVWVPLDDASEANGTLQIIPGSQSWPLLPALEIAGGDMDALKRHLTPEQLSAFVPAPVNIKAGCVEMHGEHLVHGSMPNTSDVPRRALVINYMDAQTKSTDGSRPIMPGFPVIPSGETIEGKGFPIVLDLDAPCANARQSGAE